MRTCNPVSSAKFTVSCNLRSHCLWCDEFFNWHLRNDNSFKNSLWIHCQRANRLSELRQNPVRMKLRRTIGIRERVESSYPGCYLTQWCTLIIMNNCIRQAFSSSPISLLKIFVALTTSASVFVLRTSVRICTFRIFMEQRTVIHFLTFKCLRDRCRT
jgi:hypothetical protein